MGNRRTTYLNVMRVVFTHTHYIYTRSLLFVLA
jgi:hypothetical protein